MSTTTRQLNPYVSYKEWGKVIIGGFTIPGVVLSIDGVDKPEQWLVQMGIQVSNAFSIWRGTKLAEEMTIVTNLPNSTAIAAYWSLRDKLRPNIGTKPPTFAISNAIFAFAGVTRVACKTVKPPKKTSGLSWLGEIVLIEYNPQKQAPIGPADPPPAQTENGRKKDEIVGLMGEVKKLTP